MRRTWGIRLFIGALVAVAALTPASVYAQEADKADGGLLLRVDGDVMVEAAETVDVVLVIGGDAHIAGTVKDSLVVINGDAVVTGTIDGDVQMVSGDLTLESTARVTGDVNLWRADLNQVSGATVVGSVNDQEAWNLTWAGALFSAYIWAAVTIALIVAGLVFAAVGGRQLVGASRAIAERPGPTVLTALLTVVGLPLVAILALVTVVGIPLGIGILLFLVPALWFFGYIVTGAWIGGLIVGAARRGPSAGHPYLAVFVGLLLLQVAALLPFLGWGLALFAGMLGAGALVRAGWSSFRGGGEAAPPQRERSRPTTTPAPTA